MNSRGLNDLYAYIYTPKWPIFKLMVGVIMVSVPFPTSWWINFLDVINFSMNYLNSLKMERDTILFLYIILRGVKIILYPLGGQATTNQRYAYY